MNADGSEMRAITSGPFDDREPSWSRDGSRIAFSSDRSGNYDVGRRGGDRRGTSADAPPGERFRAGAFRRPMHGSHSYPNAKIARRLDGDATTGVEASLAPAAGAVSAPSWSRDGSKVVYNVIAANRSELMLDGRDITGDEDVFPFRAQWTSPNELIYTADGKIKKRPIDGGSPSTIEFTAAVSFTRTLQIRRARFRFAIRASGARHHGAGDLAGRHAGGVRRARRSVADADRRSSEAVDQRSICRDASVVVAGWPIARVFVGSRRDDGHLGTRSRQRRRPQGAAEATKASWAPRGTEIAYITRGRDRITGRRADLIRRSAILAGRPGRRKD